MQISSVGGLIFRRLRITNPLFSHHHSWYRAPLIRATSTSFAVSPAMASEEKANVGGQISGDAPQFATYDGKEYRIVKEGLASILVPPPKEKSGRGNEGVQQVFYNPIQQFNRDLSVLAIRAYGEEALANRNSAQASKRNAKGKKRQRPLQEGEEQGGDGDRPAKVRVSEQATDESIPGLGQSGQPASKESEHGIAENGGQDKDTEADATTTPPPPPFTVLDALSATGLRALRYSHELPFVTSVTANDLTKSAVESIKLNAKHNKLEDKINANHDDAIAHMYRRIADDLSHRDARGRPSRKNKYDVIDLDPYGTASPFFDAALQAVRDDGGLLCVTCTDGSHFAGHAYAEKTFSLYNAAPLKELHSHEAGLRMIIQSLSVAAARYGLSVEPLLSLSIDFYCRIFVRVEKSPLRVSFLGGKSMIVYQCSGCSAWETESIIRTRAHPKRKDAGHFFKHGLAQGPSTDQPCRHCGSKMHLAGPMYGGQIHDAAFIRRVLDLLPTVDKAVYGTTARIEGMLTTALEELIPSPEPNPDLALNPKEVEMARVDPSPFFVVPTRLGKTVQAQAPPDAMFKGALKHLGYQVTRSHCRGGSVKTDAPWDAIWFVMREWIRQRSPVTVANINEGTPAYKILGLGDPEVAESLNSKAKEEKVDVGCQGEGDTDTVMEEAGVSRTGANGTSVSEEGKEAKDKDRLPTEEELRATLVFDEALAKLGKESGSGSGSGKNLLRYQPNPREHWGPMTKAKGR